jgi:hypothetical protein
MQSQWSVISSVTRRTPDLSWNWLVSLLYSGHTLKSNNAAGAGRNFQTPKKPDNTKDSRDVAWQVISLGTATHLLPLLLLAKLLEVRGCNPFVVIKFWVSCSAGVSNSGYPALSPASADASALTGNYVTFTCRSFNQLNHEPFLLAINYHWMALLQSHMCSTFWELT